MTTRCLDRVPKKIGLVDRPTTSGSVASLNSLAPGESGTVQHVPTVALLPALGIRHGKRLRLLARGIAGGPLLVRVDRRTIAIDRAIAGMIALRRSE